MKTAQGIQPAIEQAEKALEQASAKLAGIQQSLTQEKQKMAMLHQYHAEYRRNFQAQAQLGLSASSVQHFHQLINQLDCGMLQQQHLINKKEQQKQQYHQEWQKKYQRVQALKQLGAKYQRQAELQLVRAEQKENDEFATRQYLSVRFDPV